MGPEMPWEGGEGVRVQPNVSESDPLAASGGGLEGMGGARTGPSGPWRRGNDEGWKERPRSRDPLGLGASPTMVRALPTRRLPSPPPSIHPHTCARVSRFSLVALQGKLRRNEQAGQLFHVVPFLAQEDACGGASRLTKAAFRRGSSDATPTPSPSGTSHTPGTHTLKPKTRVAVANSPWWCFVFLSVDKEKGSKGGDERNKL